MLKSSGPVVLVADDDPFILRTLTRCFSRHGVRVLAAQTAESAEHILETEQVSHLLCDYDFGPGQPTGAELIPEWREGYPSIVVACIYTGSVLDHIPHGVDAVLQKPARADELFAALGLPVEEQASRRRRAVRQKEETVGPGAKHVLAARRK